MLKLIKTQKVYSDNSHNAFTDLVYFKGKYYISFRNGEGHISNDSKLILISSTDLKVWKEQVIFDRKDYDVRDTKLFLFNKKLYCLFPVMIWNRNRSFSMVMFTEDGKNWSKPKVIHNKYFIYSHPKEYKDKIYVTFYYYKEFFNPNTWFVKLFVSDDLLKWHYLSTIYKDEAANETALHFYKNKLIAIIRREANTSIIGESESPYNVWQYKDLGIVLHSPYIFKIDNKLLVAGRKFLLKDTWMNEKKEYEEEVIILEYQKGKFKEVLPLIGGKNIDCGYCGIEKIKNKKRQIIISYYFGNTRCADIYIAEVKI